jgi:hypothetical protein
MRNTGDFNGLFIEGKHDPQGILSSPWQAFAAARMREIRIIL